ncbi:nucleoside ABC transporter membrane protein [Mycoplasma testudineum]|uniref:Nucleoside ABC transporter membrane protein n=1 Tax=Mycoplasma testudineum TaxID=244584 RepID=A0A4R6IDV2_9MOLU|nr:ABC transporter permease [Mycoplasma testudineum]OYD26750.1 hypothetical protein CG473_02230 [Mycoplasma testudineum]TDO19886.1 nucleoside ABC transporter membrane protein [Mycoplasma testudineum]
MTENNQVSQKTGKSFYNIVNKVSTHIFSFENKSASRKIVNSLIAIVLGIVATLIIISLSEFSVDAIIERLIDNSLNIFRDNFIKLIAIYIFASLAIAIGFKAGLFNIGVPGQMMISGALTFVIITSTGANTSGGTIVVAFIVSTLAASLIAATSAALKIFFKVHEVVSTIMFNWIIYYFSQYLFRNATSPEGNTLFTATSGVSTVQITNIMGVDNSVTLFTNSSSALALLLSTALICAILFFFVLRFTATGYKIKMLGINPNAAKYGGTNEKMMTISLFAISGFLAGVAGFYYFLFYKYLFTFDGSPLITGFNSISVALIAYNNPIGIIFSSVLYAFFEVGVQNILVRNVGTSPSEYYFVLVGFLMFFIAIAVVFGNIRPYYWIHKEYVKYKYGAWTKKNSQEKYLKIVKKLDSYLDVDEHTFMKNLDKADIGFGQKIKILKMFYKLRYKKNKLMIQEKLKLNSEQISVIQKHKKEAHDKYVSSSSKVSKEEKIDNLEKFGQIIKKLNLELDNLGANDLKDLKTEMKTKRKLVRSLINSHKDNMLHAHNKAWLKNAKKWNVWFAKNETKAEYKNWWNAELEQLSKLGNEARLVK